MRPPGLPLASVGCMGFHAAALWANDHHRPYRHRSRRSRRDPGPRVRPRHRADRRAEPRTRAGAPHRPIAGPDRGRGSAHALASMMRFIGVWAARRKWRKPASSKTWRSFASPAWAPRASADLLRQRVGRADARRGHVEQGRHRVLGDVPRPRVDGERLDEHDRAAGPQVLAGVPGGADRVAHVVQAVEEADQVEFARRTRSRWRPGSRRARSPPPRAARSRHVAIEGAWKSNPVKTEFGYAAAIVTTDAPCPHPTSATRAPALSFGFDAVERGDPLRS